MLDVIFSSFMSGVAPMHQNITDALSKNSTLDNTVDMLQLQFNLKQYSNYISLTSTAAKTIGDLVSSIIAKM